MLTGDQIARLEAELEALQEQRDSLNKEIHQAEGHIVHGSPEPGRWLAVLRDLYMDRDGVSYQIGRVEALLDDTRALREILDARGSGSPASPDDWYRRSSPEQNGGEPDGRDQGDREPDKCRER